MAALLLSAAGLLSVRDDIAAGAEPSGYVHGGWEWCEVWVPGDFEAHELGSRHHESCRLAVRYGRCRPRGSKGFRDAIVVAVDKARECDGLEAFAEGRRGTRSRPLLTEPHMCAVLQQALHQELVLSCGSTEHADKAFAQNAWASLPTLERGQDIRGHYRNAGELVIHARPCLALLPAYLGLLSHVQHLRILVDPHRVLHNGTPYTSATIASLGHFLPSMLQRRLTFQWDLWSGRPLTSLPALEQATCRFLQTAAASLTTSSMSPLREIVFEIYDYNIPEPQWLQQARGRFNAMLAAAADARRQALLMCLHRRSAAAGCLLYRLPAVLLQVIMTEAIKSVSCTCSVISSMPELETIQGVQQLEAEIHAHDEVVAQRAAAAAEVARRCRGRAHRALIMGAVASASLLLAAARHSEAEQKERRREAAAATAAADAAAALDATAAPDTAGEQAVTWAFVVDPTTNTLRKVILEHGPVE